MSNATGILFTTVAALIVATTTAQAQATGSGGTAVVAVAKCGPGFADSSCDNLPRPRSRLFTGIELTKAQMDSIDAITLRYRALYNTLGEEHLPAPAHNAQVLALRGRERAEKRKVMAPDQLPRFDANADSLRKRDEEAIATGMSRASAERETPRRAPARP